MISTKIFTISFWIVTIVTIVLSFLNLPNSVFFSLHFLTSFFFFNFTSGYFGPKITTSPKRRVLCNRDIQDQPRIRAKLSKSTLAGLPAMLEEINSKQLERYQKDQQKNPTKTNKTSTRNQQKKRTLGTCPKIKQNRVPRRAIFTTTASTSWCFFFFVEVLPRRSGHSVGQRGDHFFIGPSTWSRPSIQFAQNRQDWNTHLSVEV